jgi:hypothetical protein
MKTAIACIERIAADNQVLPSPNLAESERWEIVKCQIH